MTEYEVIIRVIEGGFEHIGPMTEARSYYVEVSIDGNVTDTDRSSHVKIRNGKIVWDKKFFKTFEKLETPTPTMITLTMYKKRLIQQGEKLIGTTNICLNNLIKIVNEPAVRQKIPLIMSKHSISGPSYLIIELQVRTLSEEIANTDRLSEKEESKAVNFIPFQYFNKFLKQSSITTTSTTATTSTNDTTTVCSTDIDKTSSTKASTNITTNSTPMKHHIIIQIIFICIISILFILLILAITTAILGPHQAHIKLIQYLI